MNNSHKKDISVEIRILLGNSLASSAGIDLSWIKPPPSDRGWVMAGDGLRYLTALAKLLKPQHILEFGSGISTQVLARATEAYPEKCSITSVDHDPIFGKQVATKFSRKKKT